MISWKCMKMSSEFGVKLFDTHPEVQVAVGNGLDLGYSDGIPWQKRPGFAGFFLSWRRLTTTLSSRLTSSPCNTIQYHGIPVYLCVWWCKVWETGCHPISVRSNMEGISLFFYGTFILRGLFFDYQYWLEQKNFSTIALPTHSLGLNIHWTCTWLNHVEPSKNGMIKAYQGRISGHRQDPLTSCISCPKRMAAPMPTSTSLIQF